MYPIVDTQLRQSATDAGSGNVITDIPFGAKVEVVGKHHGHVGISSSAVEIILHECFLARAKVEVLEKTPEWAHVKYTPASREGKLEGYMAAPALIDPAHAGFAFFANTSSLVSNLVASSAATASGPPEKSFHETVGLYRHCFGSDSCVAGIHIYI